MSYYKNQPPPPKVKRFPRYFDPTYDRRDFGISSEVLLWLLGVIAVVWLILTLGPKVEQTYPENVPPPGQVPTEEEQRQLDDPDGLLVYPGDPEYPTEEEGCDNCPDDPGDAEFPPHWGPS